MRVVCDKCNSIFYLQDKQIQKEWVKVPRRSNDLLNIALDNLVLDYGYKLIKLFDCPCGNTIEILEKENTENEQTASED